MIATATETTPSSAETAAVFPTVGELIIHYLKLEGVTHVFGIPGAGLIHFLVDLKNNEDAIKYIVARQETGAAYMADGYYRATGKLGVVVVTTGPGATNALTGTMNAQADGSALLLITGEVDQKFSGLGYLQEGDDTNLNINEIYNAATGYSNTITSYFNAETIVKQALRDALLMPRQAVHISLPVNVSIENVASSKLSAKTSSYRCAIKGAPYEEVRNAMATILACKRPLLFIGNNCRQALQDAGTYSNLLLFTENYGIPVMTTPDGKGLYPEQHDLSLRVYGIADCMWPYAYLNDPEYDGIIVLGSNLGEMSTNSWLPLLVPKPPEAPFIQVDINPKIIARSFETTHAVISEPGAFINDLAGLINDFEPDKQAVAERKQAIAELKKAHSPFITTDGYYSDESPVEPAALMRVIQNTIPPTTNIYIDAGNCVGWAVHFLAIQAPTTIHTSLTMGPMGFGVCSVIGAKLGSPDSTCIAIVGDGAFLMHGNELSTASKYNIGAIWIVLFDNGLAMVTQGMNHFCPDANDPGIWDKLYDFGKTDLVLFSRSLGADAYGINAPAELEAIMPEVLRRANEDHVPQVIVAHINTQSMPPYYNPIYQR